MKSDKIEKESDKGEEKGSGKTCSKILVHWTIVGTFFKTFTSNTIKFLFTERKGWDWFRWCV
jgi:hypothetical protein